MKAPLNFVWFCTDQQRFDTISALGNSNIRTPNIDRLAAEGVAFTRAYTQAPVCTPSRACFLTGRYPRSTRACYNGNDFFPKDETLITKILSDNGYSCGLTGKLHLAGARGRMEPRGDDGYSFMRWSHHPHDDWPAGINHYQDWLSSQGKKWEDIYGGEYLTLSEWPPRKKAGFTGKSTGAPVEYHQTTWCVSEAINFIDMCGNAPWLVSINPFDPHPPLDPPQEYKDKLNIADMPLPLRRDGELDNKPPHQQKDYIIGGQDGQTTPISKISDETKREKRRDYYAQIMLIDDQLGRLMDYLEKTGQRENTVIIFCSDHGEMNGDHGLYWKGAYFYEQLVHVPLIISCPGLIKSGVKSNALVELVDLAPTILELSGIDIPAGMQGVSLAPLLTGRVCADYHKDAVYCEYYSSMIGCHEGIYATMYYDGKFKIVVYHGEDYGELYDLENDPGEFENLWDVRIDLRNEYIKKNFDNAILRNKDMSLMRIHSY